MRKLALLPLLLLFCSSICVAGVSITQVGENLVIAWDAHPQALELTEFRFYHTLTSGTYTDPPIATFTPGSATTGTVPKPTQLGRHYYTLTAVKIQGTLVLESLRSNEIHFDVLPEAPTLRSIILQMAQALRDLADTMVAQLQQIKEP